MAFILQYFRCQVFRGAAKGLSATLRAWPTDPTLSETEISQPNMAYSIEPNIEWRVKLVKIQNKIQIWKRCIHLYILKTTHNIFSGFKSLYMISALFNASRASVISAAYNLLLCSENLRSFFNQKNNSPPAI